ncbi:sulfurtransferase TusA family protein [Terasakiella sp. SH-1]|uniref:sulfurtransferase TusA family protein n=1 Tax=Terasakiella sp. SH-1 TaxID=2560057 RepID=UPI001F0DE2B3|nr:sulfurtransferase TusA family protein [Terasakiella sp. SH-1]
MMQIDRTLDASGMRCPIPVLRAGKEIRAMQSGEVIEIIATDGQAPRDFHDFCLEAGHEILISEERDGKYVIIIRKG